MGRYRKKSDTDAALNLVIWILFLIPLAVFFFIKWLVVGIAAAGNASKRPAKVDCKTIEEIDLMSGVEFENYIAGLLRNLGYKKVQTTPGSGDYGVDILAEKDGWKTAFQCKCYQSSIGVSAVQEVFAGAKMYRADKAVVVTNSHFTPNAKKMAIDIGVSLWDRDALIKMINMSAKERQP